VFSREWFNIAMTSDRLSFALIEIDKLSLGSTLVETFSCVTGGTVTTATRVFLPTTREAAEREPGNEAVGKDAMLQIFEHVELRFRLT